MGTNAGFGYVGVREEGNALDVDRVQKLVFPDGTCTAREANEVFVDINPGTFADTVYASLSAAVTAIGATVGTLRISTANFPNGATCTVPATLKLEFVGAGSILMDTGETVTILSDTSNYPIRKIFFNALASQGIISFSGSHTGVVSSEWWGAKGDDSTDDTAAIQAAIDCLSAAGGGAILFGFKVYVIAGALQDTSLSNSQLVLPKVNASANMKTIRFIGQVAPAQATPHDGDKLTMLRSTLATGSGAMIGVRANNGSGTGSQNEVAHNAMSYIMFQAENINFRMPANPTNSALDLRFIPNVLLENVRIDVMGITVTLTSGVIPNLACTEPTHSGSYALLLPIDYIPNAVMLNNLEILGYYNAWRWGEFVSANNVTIAICRNAFEMRGATHASCAQKILCVACVTVFKVMGLDPYFSSGIATNQVTIQQLDWENAASGWNAAGNTIDDASNLLYGNITWVSGYTLVKNGGANVKMHNVSRPWALYRPYTNITGTDLDVNGHAVHEIYRGLATGGINANLAWLLLTSKQSGTAHALGVIAFNNDQIADGSNKIMGQIDVVTDGATNSGKMQISTSKAGVSTIGAQWDSNGNLIQVKMLLFGEGPALTITSNTIAPTYRHHAVGAGLLKTITLPVGPGTGVAHEFVAFPTAAFTWDTTGNIGGGGALTAVVGRPLTFTWIPSAAKWATSY